MPVRIRGSFLAVAVTAAAALVGVGTGTASAAPVTSPGGFIATAPTRLLDTRNGTGRAGTSPVAAGGSVTVRVTGSGTPIPVGAAAAVTVNVTAVAPSGTGYLTVYPGGTRPTVSSLNFVKGQIVANAVTVPVSSAGTITVFNGSGGTVHLLTDLNGYTLAGTPTVPGAAVATAPTRLLDTRNGTGRAGTSPVAAGGSVTVRVTGSGTPIPVGAAAAVTVNVTAVAPSGTGYLTVYPGGTRPTVSSLNFVKGQIVANAVTVPVSAAGTITVFNGSGGTVHLLTDLNGYTLAGTPTVPGAAVATAPTRLLDTRNGTGRAGTSPVAAGGSVTVRVTGSGTPIPVGAAAAVTVNVTAVAPSGTGYLTVYPGGTRPTVSSLNFVKGQIVANAVTVPVSSAGTITVFNGSSGTVHLLTDLNGYTIAGPPDTTAPAPVTGLTATPATDRVTLTWTNPPDTDLTGVVVRRASGTAPPSSPTAGTAVTTTPAGTQSYVDTGLAMSSTYSYALFARDNVGNTSAATTVTTTTPGNPNAPAFEVERIDPPHGNPTDVSCPESTYCLAVDQLGAILDWNGTTWSAPRPNPLGVPGRLSCASRRFCSVVSGDRVATYNGTAWAVTRVTGIEDFLSVSCPSSTFCMASAIATSPLGTRSRAVRYDGSSWTVLPALSGEIMNGVDCPTTTFCAGLSDYGFDEAYVHTYRAGAWRQDTVVYASLAALSCASATFCTATGMRIEPNRAAATVGFDGTRWGAVRTWGSDTPSITAVACTSSTSCVGAGDNGWYYNGATWTREDELLDDGDGGITALDCPTAGSCIALTERGVAWTRTAAGWSGDRFASSTQDVDCPTSTFCAGVGYSSTGAGATVRTLDGGTLSPPTTLALTVPHVACASAVACIAWSPEDRGSVWSGFDGTSWSAPSSVGFTGVTVDNLACAPDAGCTAVGRSRDGYVAVVGDADGWSAPVRVPSSAEVVTLLGLSCPTTAACVAVFETSVARAPVASLTFDGDTWSAPVALPDDVYPGTVDCAATDFCIAAGAGGPDAATATVTRFDGSAWSASEVLDGVTPFSELSCPTATFCLAVGTGGVTEYHDGAWTTEYQLPTIEGYAGVVSCASATRCVAAFDEALTWDGGDWQVVATVDGSGGLGSISCVDTTWCMAVGNDGAWRWSGGAWQRTAVDTEIGLTDVSCVTRSFCVATTLRAGVVQWDGSAWATPTRVLTGVATLRAVSCVTIAFCVAGGSSDDTRDRREVGVVAQWNGSGWSEQVTVASGFGQLVNGVSCWAVTACRAVTVDGTVATLAAGGWSDNEPVRGLGGFAPFQISCAALGSCALAGYEQGRTAVIVLDGTTGTHVTFRSPTLPPYDGTTVDCHTVGRCVTIDGNGYAYVVNGTSFVTAGRPATDGTRQNDVDCPSPSFCVVV